MARKCDYTGKRPKRGMNREYRGRAKYLGGVGRKVTGKSKRTFKPNVQDVNAIVGGKRAKVRASAKAMKMGLVAKSPKRRHVYRPQSS